MTLLQSADLFTCIQTFSAMPVARISHGKERESSNRLACSKRMCVCMCAQKQVLRKRNSVGNLFRLISIHHNFIPGSTSPSGHPTYIIIYYIPSKFWSSIHKKYEKSICGLVLSRWIIRSPIICWSKWQCPAQAHRFFKEISIYHKCKLFMY